MHFKLCNIHIFFVIISKEHIELLILILLARQSKFMNSKEIIMVTSIILVNVERSKINETAEELAATDGISEVYSVSGNYDLIAVARVKSNEELSDLVTRNLLKIESILKTETLLAFKAYSRHDLEAIFSIGTEAG